MKKHAIIPIFVPHIGCSESCVFCDQNQITARSKAPSLEDVRETIETWLSTLNSEIEIAFYGGSFTAIPISMQERYLSVAKEYLDKGLISGLHLSTRPDCITPEILDMLASYGVKTIELGVQSFDDDVLIKSKRGHDSDTVRRACELIKSHKSNVANRSNSHESNEEARSFKLGIQLMIGLPGDSLESCIYSARETAKLMPDLARLYPTLVLDGTELMEMYRSGDYSPLSRDEAVLRTKMMYEILTDAGIYVMRVGLKSTDIINSENLGEINSGTYHPAFRQLVEGEIAKDRIEKLLSDYLNDKINITIKCAPSWVSNAAGHKGINREYFAKKFPNLSLFFEPDDSLKPAQFLITKR